MAVVVVADGVVALMEAFEAVEAQRREEGSKQVVRVGASEPRMAISNHDIRRLPLLVACGCCADSCGAMAQGWGPGLRVLSFRGMPRLGDKALVALCDAISGWGCFGGLEVGGVRSASG